MKAEQGRLIPGGCVTYTAEFSRMIGDHTGRRGTFLKYDDQVPQYARVRWHNFEATRDALTGAYGEDIVADMAERGELILAINITSA